MRFLTPGERSILSAKSYKKIARYSEYTIKHVVPNCFRCNHCYRDVYDIPQNRRSSKYHGGLLTLKEILAHLQKQ